MSKEAEQNYLAMIGAMGRAHSLDKPFSNPDCGLTLASIGSVMMLMPPAPAAILDLGCGSGWTSVFLRKHGYQVVGQDISADMIALGEENKAINRIKDGLTFVQSDYENLEFAEAFEGAIFFDSLHHADDPGAAIRCAYKALKPGGVLITHEPGEGHSQAPWSIDAMRLYGVNEKDMPPHLIKRHALDAGFREFRVYPMQHDLHHLFYREKPPRLMSKAGASHVSRILRMLFKPDERIGAIVWMRK